MFRVCTRFERSEIRIERMREMSASASALARALWRSSAVERVAASKAVNAPTATIMSRSPATTTSIRMIPP